MMYQLVFLSLILLKMNIGSNLSLSIKVLDTHFYLLGESKEGASWVFSMATLEFMGGDLVVS